MIHPEVYPLPEYGFVPRRYLSVQVVGSLRQPVLVTKRHRFIHRRTPGLQFGFVQEILYDQKAVFPVRRDLHSR